MNDIVEYEEKIKQLTERLDDLEKSYPKLLPTYLRSYQNHLIEILPYIEITNNDDFYMESVGAECEGNEATINNASKFEQEYEQLCFDGIDIKTYNNKQRAKYVTNDRFKYKILPDKSGIEIMEVLNHDKPDIVIPATIEYLPVLSIGKSVFENTSISSVNLPNTIKSLGKRTFYGCKKLRTISLPDSLNEIDEECFSESGLTEIKVNVERIPNRCFYNCRNMKSVELGDKTVFIGVESFNGTTIQEVIIPENVRYIYDNAFVFATDNPVSVGIKSLCCLGKICNIYVRDSNNHLELTVYCLPGSKAQGWARSKGITVRPVDDFLYDKDIIDIF